MSCVCYILTYVYIDHTHILLVMHTICCLAGYLLGSFVCLLVLFVVSLCHIGTVTNTIATDSFLAIAICLVGSLIVNVTWRLHT